MSRGTFASNITKNPYKPETYMEELALLQKGNPEITGHDKNKDERIVWAFSGRTSVLGRSDGIQEKRALQEKKPNGIFADPTDDIDRLLLAIEVSQKHGGVKILYNGTNDENKDLEAFLKACREATSLPDFKTKIPADANAYHARNYNDKQLWQIISKFRAAAPLIIVDGKDIKNSLDQVRGFNEFLNNHKEIQHVDGVSSAFHLPRLARSISHYIGSSADLLIDYKRFRDIKSFHLHGSDLNCERPGTKEFDIKSEADAIKNYIANGSISASVSEKVSLSTSPEKYREIASNTKQINL